MSRVPTSMFRCALGLAALSVLAPGCFDEEELTLGLKCTQSSHCGGSLECISGYCADPSECATDPVACMQDLTSSASLTAADASASQTTDPSMTGASMTAASMTAASMTGADDSTACADQYGDCYSNGGCCNFGICVDYGNGTATCQEQCNIGTECPSCCCIQTESGANACVDLMYCGPEALCTGGCASPGSACYGDTDCCNGGRCLLNSGNWYSCFKPCVSGTECVSGCCNYNASIGANICEAC